MSEPETTAAIIYLNEHTNYPIECDCGRWSQGPSRVHAAGHLAAIELEARNAAVEKCLGLVFENLDLHVAEIEERTRRRAISAEDWQFLNGYRKARKNLWDACFPSAEGERVDVTAALGAQNLVRS